MPTYDRPPIIEAIYEFAPVGAALGDSGIRRLKDQFAAEYTGRSDAVVGSAGYEIEWGPAGSRASPLPPGPLRHRLWAADNSALVQFGTDLFAFNALPPYSSYASYVPRMEPAFARYRAATGTTKVSFLGQRYLNRIALPSLDAPPREFFTLYPALPGERRASHRPFSMSVQTEEVQRGQVIVTLTYQGPDAERRPSYILDIYARTVDNPGMDFEWDRVKAWQDLAHTALNRAFEFAITEDCRTLLGRRPE
jgi:uncharacterized protein (TIGR04255 family)